MYAVIVTGGKQYQVKAGDEIYIEKLDAAAEETVTFDKVLVLGEGEGKISVGNPYVSGATVTGTVLKTGKAKKITVEEVLSDKGGDIA